MPFRIKLPPKNHYFALFQWYNKGTSSITQSSDGIFQILSRNLILIIVAQYGTHHSYVLVVHTLRVAENEILKLDLPAKRH
jgi:hypothetical protein